MLLLDFTRETSLAYVYSCAGTSQSFVAGDVPLNTAKSAVDSTLATVFDNGNIIACFLLCGLMFVNVTLLMLDIVWLIMRYTHQKEEQKEEEEVL